MRTLVYCGSRPKSRIEGYLFPAGEPVEVPDDVAERVLAKRGDLFLDLTDNDPTDDAPLGELADQLPPAEDDLEEVLLLTDFDPEPLPVAESD